MNNDIKKILDTPIFIIDNEGFTVYINDTINDYITNLQKENEKLKNELKSKPDNEITLETKDGQIMTIIQSERIDMQEKLNKSLNNAIEKYLDYKQRNEKAAENAKEKIKKYENYIHDLKNGNYPSPTVRLERQELIFKIREQEDLINILEGDDEE